MKKRSIEKGKKEREKKERADRLESAKFSINRRNSSLPDLLSLSMPSNDEDQPYEYQPFHIEKIQLYNPIYSVLFPSVEKSMDSFSLDQRFEFVDMNTVYDHATHARTPQPVFIKFSPLLDPIRYMIGKYNDQSNELRELPSPSNKCHSKIENPHNASYVDGFFSFLSGQLLQHHGMFHATQYYGSYVGIQEKYKMNITDDFEYLNDSPFFHSKIGELFEISHSNPLSIQQFGSRGNKKKLSILENDALTTDDLSVFDVEEVVDAREPVIDPLSETEILVYEKSIVVSSVQSSHSSTDSSNNSEANDTSSEDNDEEDEDEEDEDHEDDDEDEDHEDEDEEDCEVGDEPQVYAYIRQFPVQMICLEKCDGTFDELLCKGVIDEYLGASALFQIIMTLLIYQKSFHFTHNDLHTNNIMYVHTTEEFLYYIYDGKKYRVPTFGYIYKIIDFGRSIYKFEGKIFCSDSFAPSGDAYSQYNFEPFFNEEKPRIDPNYSFDLCRLGCSIYDFIIDDDEDDVRDMDDFQKTIYRWCTDDQDKNVLYKKNGEERYPNFKLYKMIARTVHRHTPQEQLKFKFFKQFEVSDKMWKTVDSSRVLEVDSIPSYV